MNAVILAGGKGARLAPYTTILPKPLMPIGDMPILEMLLRQMKRAQVDEVVLTVGHLAHLMQAFFQDGERLGLKTSYSYEEHPLGTAGPLSFVEGFGVYFCEPRVLSYIPYNQYLDFPDLILRLIQAGEQVSRYPFDGYWQDLGLPDDYEQAGQGFEKMKTLILGEEG